MASILRAYTACSFKWMPQMSNRHRCSFSQICCWTSIMCGGVLLINKETQKNLISPVQQLSSRDRAAFSGKNSFLLFGHRCWKFCWSTALHNVQPDASSSAIGESLLEHTAAALTGTLYLAATTLVIEALRTLGNCHMKPGPFLFVLRLPARFVEDFFHFCI